MAITAQKLWVDGTIVAVRDDAARASLMSHAMQRGSLVFDVGAFHSSHLFRARDHVARFKRSAKIVGLAIDLSDDALVDAARAVAKVNALTDGLIRWSVFYDANEPDLIPRNPMTHIAVAAMSLQDAPSTKPIAIAVYPDAKKAAPDMLPPEAKAAAAYLGPMIARKRAIADGFDDVVLLDVDGSIAEAPIANVFLVNAQRELVTPSLGRILPGITRDTILALARRGGIVVREARVSLEDLENAHEAFLTATSLPLAPIGRVNARILADAPGEVTSLLLEQVTNARATHAEWLTKI